jgi:hypothetical protein
MVNRGEFVVNIWLRDGRFIGLKNGTGFWGLFFDRKSDWKAALGIDKNKQEQRQQRQMRGSFASLRMTTKTRARATAAATATTTAGPYRMTNKRTCNGNDKYRDPSLRSG